MIIKHITNSEIDNLKWDKKVRDAFNGSIFGFSWYLDIVADGWEALVSEDYDFVMPLPVKQMMGVNYIDMPKYVTHFSIYTKKELTDDISSAFLAVMPYPVLNYKFSVFNGIEEQKNFNLAHTKTYKLDLIKSYRRIKSGFKSDFKMQLVKAISANIAVQNGILPVDFVEFMQHKAVVHSRAHQDDIEMLRRIAVNAVRYRVGTIYGAYNKRNSLCAVALFVGSHNSSFFVAAAASKSGLQEHAFTLLLDVFFEQQAEHNLTVHLEAIDLPNKEKVFVDIGAESYPQLCITQNKLPWYLKVVKI